MVTYILLALGIVSLILFLVSRDKYSSPLAIALKTLTSLFFIAMAASAVVENALDMNELEVESLVPSCLVIMGLVLGMVGDITLDFKIYFKGLKDQYNNAGKDADFMMYFGMIAFAIGHIMYITSVAIRFPEHAMDLLWTALISVGFVIVMFTVSCFVLKMKFGKFLVPCICYGFLLCWFLVFSVWAMNYSDYKTPQIVLLIGAIMFVLSDLILSMTYFSKESDYEKKGILNPESRLFISLNHITYYAAQFLIAVSVLFI